MTEGPRTPSNVAEAPALSKRARPAPPWPSRRRAFLGAGLAAAATLALVFVVWPASEQEDLRQGPNVPSGARLRGPERAGTAEHLSRSADAQAVPGEDTGAGADQIFACDVPTGQLPPTLRSLRWSTRGEHATLSAHLAMPQPGRYAAYAEVAVPTSDMQQIAVFSRTRFEVPNETGADIFLTFRSLVFRNLNSTSRDTRTIYLRKFLVKRVDRHPTITVAEVAGLTLFTAKEAAPAAAKRASRAETRDSSAPRD